MKTKAFELAVKSYRTSKEHSDIVWNFGKFLIDSNGNVVERFSPALEPKDFTANIEKLL